MGNKLEMVQFLSHCSSFFGSLPHYDWERRTVTSNVIHKLAAIIKIICVLLAYILGFRKRLEFSFNYRPTVIVVLHTFALITELMLICLNILISVFGSMQKWEILLGFVGDRALGEGKKSKFTLLYAVCHVFNITILVPIAYKWMTFADTEEYWKFYVAATTSTYNEAMTTFLYVFIAYSIMHEFKKINNKLSQIIKRNNAHTGTMAYAEQIRQIKKEFKSLYYVVDVQNSIYGFQILSLLTECTVYLQCAACATVIALEYSNLHGHPENGMAWINGSISVLIGVRPSNYFLNYFMNKTSGVHIFGEAEALICHVNK